MKKSFLIKIGVFLLVCASAGTLMSISQQVQRAERDLVRLELSIAREQEAQKVLQAEWGFLNRPERIEALAKQHLGMVSPSPEDILPGTSVFSDMPFVASFHHQRDGVIRHDISYPPYDLTLEAPESEASRMQSARPFPVTVPRKPLDIYRIEPAAGEGGVE